MKPMSEDTPPEIERMLIEGYRRMTPRAKLQRVVELNELVEQMAAGRIRRQYGSDISKRELKLRLAALRLERETMIEVFGWDPEVMGY